MHYSLILVSFPDVGEEYPIHDSGCSSVRDHLLQAVADLDPQFAVFGHDKQSQSVIAAFLADPPCFKSADSPFFDRISCRGFVDINDELVPGGFFEKFELFI